MSKFKGEEIIKIIDALNGSISPVGETNVDNQRYDNSAGGFVFKKCINNSESNEVLNEM